MSLGGLPLTAGFVSKLLILISVYNETSFATGFAYDLIFWALVIAVINSALAFGGYLWILKEMVFNPSNGELEAKESPNNYVRALFLVLALSILVLGIFPQLLLDPLESII
jgi:NADH:ubiquinone oxidoreductase subunit 2 (subunit N)